MNANSQTILPFNAAILSWDEVLANGRSAVDETGELRTMNPAHLPPEPDLPDIYALCPGCDEHSGGGIFPAAELLLSDVCPAGQRLRGSAAGQYFEEKEDPSVEREGSTEVVLRRRGSARPSSLLNFRSLLKNWARSRWQALASRSRNEEKGDATEHHRRRVTMDCDASAASPMGSQALRSSASLLLLHDTTVSRSSSCLALNRKAWRTRPDPDFQQVANADNRLRGGSFPRFEALTPESSPDAGPRFSLTRVQALCSGYVETQKLRITRAWFFRRRAAVCRSRLSRIANAASSIS